MSFPWVEIPEPTGECGPQCADCWVATPLDGSGCFTCDQALSVERRRAEEWALFQDEVNSLLIALESIEGGADGAE